MMDSDDKRRIPWPNPQSAEYQLRKLSEWWDANHQAGGLPYSCMTALIDFPHATRGAVRERAQGWKWWMPNVLLALPRGGYGALFLYVRGIHKGQTHHALKAEEQEVAEQLVMAGNCVRLAAGWRAAVDMIAEYVAGNTRKGEA